MPTPKDIRFEDLDLNLAQEFVSTQDPDRGLRFFLPIPNWQAASISHEKIVDVPNKGQRYTFKNFTDKNYVDDADASDNQGVKIDGSAAIIFSSLNLKTANQLDAIVAECSNNHADFSPDVITEILKRTAEIGLGDRFNKSLSSIDEFFHPYHANGYLGMYLPNENKHIAVYLDGAGRYMDGPTIEPQEFSDGAFISFPGFTLSDEFNRDDLKAKGRLVQAHVFIHDRDKPNGQRVDLSHMLG